MQTGAAYTAAKHASVGLTRAMAVELGSQGNITCNCIQPGPVRTGMTGPIPERQKDLPMASLRPFVVSACRQNFQIVSSFKFSQYHSRFL